MTPTDQLCAVLSAFSDVEQTQSRFGSRNPAWSVSGREFAHLHAPHLIDLRLPRAIQATLRADTKAHFRKGASEWIELEFHTQSDVAQVASLGREAWAAARKTK